ncbi:MobA/MobL family protein [Sphingomonas sp.]|uniref:MobA/MobL family protein n=1 Tax=Sphingomonas sp. TaxID=28214 RepID=UPI002DD641E5|nr:MobA/MobL family protein [Sphingomonas sp.]
MIDGALSYARHYDYIVRQAGGCDPGDPTPPIDILDFEEEHRAENVLAVISNIGTTRERQRGLFAAAERCERQARGGTLSVSTRHAGAWRAAAAEPDAPEWIEAASRKLDIAEANLLTPSRRNKLDAKDVTLCRVNLEQAHDRLVEADRIFGKRSQALPIFAQGRSGRIQTRFVLELPRNLDVRSQHEIVQRFGDRLAADGWMYAAAIHRPDPHNERTNIHAHIDAYDRPCRWLDEQGCWDFEYRERKRNGKWTYPYRQNKIAIARGEAGRSNGLSVASTYYKGLRAAYVAIANDVIDGREDNPHYVVGTYRQNGIRLTPLKHLGNRITAAEKRGVVTPAGTRNALILFGDRLRQVRFDLTAARRELHIRARAGIAAAKTAAAERAIREWRRHEAAVLLRQAQSAVMEVAGGLLRSRAEAVIAHQRGDDQSAAKRREERAVVNDARAWLAGIDALQPLPHDRDAEAAIVAQHHAAALSARDAADSHDRNAVPDLVYHARFSHQVSVGEDYRDVTRGRLLEWLDANGQDETALVLNDAQVTTGPGVPKAIDRLFRLFIADRAVQERLHREKLNRQLRAIIDDPGIAEPDDLKTEQWLAPRTAAPSAPNEVRVPAPVVTAATASSPPLRGILAQAQRLSRPSLSGQRATTSKTPGDRSTPNSATPASAPDADMRGTPGVEPGDVAAGRKGGGIWR